MNFLVIFIIKLMFSIMSMKHSIFLIVLQYIFLNLWVLILLKILAMHRNQILISLNLFKTGNNKNESNYNQLLSFFIRFSNYNQSTFFDFIMTAFLTSRKGLYPRKPFIYRAFSHFNAIPFYSSSI